MIPPSIHWHPLQTLTYDGERFQGRDAIMAKLQKVADMHWGFRVVHQPLDVDSQALGVVSGT